MIVPMKKIALIVQAKDTEMTVRQLGSLGVLHVENQNTPVGKDISALHEEIALAGRAAEILSIEDFSGKSGLKSAVKLLDWSFVAKHISDLFIRIEQLEEYARNLQNRIGQWEDWGDFDPESVLALRSKGINIKLYRIASSELKNIPERLIVKKIFSRKGTVNIAVISRGDIRLPFKELELPKMGLREMRLRYEENEAVIAQIKDGIRKYTVYLDRFTNVKASFEKELEFREAIRGAGVGGKLAYVTGYIPFDLTHVLEKESRNRGWGIVISEPSDEDNVPTLVRNPKWVSIIEPVFKLIQIVPGYREFDISLWFLLFFSVFFGMLIGDAGYGAIFFGITLFSQIKWGKKLKDKSIFVLFYVLSSFAIIWGLLSGTIFGQAWLPAWVQPIIPSLRNDLKVQSLCFFIGALHLTIAHVWRTINKAPSLSALGEIGWILVLWGGYFLAKLLILARPFPQAAKWLFIIGPVFVVLFSSPRKNILKGIGEGFGSLLLNVVNSFTDVVSYVRLFAVGLATVAVADAFNTMAMDIGFTGILTGLATALILIMGHLLNMVLGPMSVLVHGVRLNVLEFSSHIDIKWSGFSYKPLKQNS